MSQSMIKTEKQGSYLRISSADVHSLIRRELDLQGLNYQCTSPGSDNRISRYRLTDISIEDGLSQLTPEIYFRNSETPGTALMLYIGAYRFICANGLVLGVGDGGRLIHRVGQTADQFVAGMEQMIRSSLISLTDDLQETIDSARAAPVSNPIEIVASLPIQNRVREDVIRSIALGATKENVNTVWGLYNEVNARVRVRSRGPNTALAKDIGLLDHITLLNQYARVA